MGKKYIIELNPDCVEGEYLRIPARIAGEQQWLMTKAVLTPCTELDLEQVRKEAYEKGYKTAKCQCNIQAEKDLREVGERHYQKGLSDAWEAARKIGSNSMCSLKEMGFDFSQCVIADYNPSWFVVKNYSASECIEKIQQYEQSQEEIKVGDEVGYYGVADEHGNVCYSGVVLEIRKDDYLVMEKDGKTYQLKKKLVMSKTGRSFPEIAAVLQKMRGEQE